MARTLPSMKLVRAKNVRVQAEAEIALLRAIAGRSGLIAQPALKSGPRCSQVYEFGKIDSSRRNNYECAAGNDVPRGPRQPTLRPRAYLRENAETFYPPNHWRPRSDGNVPLRCQQSPNRLPPLNQ